MIDAEALNEVAVGAGEQFGGCDVLGVDPEPSHAAQRQTQRVDPDPVPVLCKGAAHDAGKYEDDRLSLSLGVSFAANEGLAQSRLLLFE